MNGRDTCVQLRTERRAETAAKPPRFHVAERLCLDCRQTFRSQWCGNRICEACSKLSRSAFTGEVTRAAQKPARVGW